MGAHRRCPAGRVRVGVRVMGRQLMPCTTWAAEAALNLSLQAAEAALDALDDEEESLAAQVLTLSLTLNRNM